MTIYYCLSWCLSCYPYSGNIAKDGQGVGWGGGGGKSFDALFIWYLLPPHKIRKQRTKQRPYPFRLHNVRYIVHLFLSHYNMLCLFGNRGDIWRDRQLTCLSKSQEKNRQCPGRESCYWDYHPLPPAADLRWKPREGGGLREIVGFHSKDPFPFMALWFAPTAKRKGRWLWLSLWRTSTSRRRHVGLEGLLVWWSQVPIFIPFVCKWELMGP